MKFVDDTLAAAAPARGGKAGAKPAALAAQKDAFNRAFSEAGKKQQPQISIRDKAGPETPNAQNIQGVQSRISIQTSNTAVAAGKNVDETSQPPVKSAVNEHSLLESTQGQPQAPADVEALALAKEPAPSAKDMKTREETKPARAAAALAQIGAQNSQAGEGTPTTEDVTPSQTDLARKLADIFKERQAQFTSKTPQDEKTTSSLADEQVAQQATGDLDQLLALLGAAQTAPATKEASENSSELSEFQALAERAGKQKPPTKEVQHATKAGEAAHETATVAGATPTAEKSETDQLFRFARADGKGQDVSISINKDTDTATVDTSGAQTAKAETVTVVEARRYLGLATTSNAQTVTSAIAGSAEWAQSVQTLTNETSLHQQATGKVVNTLKIQMHPIDLGLVTATLRLRDDELHVDLKVETSDAFRQLNDDQNAMVKALRAQGFAVDQVNIVYNAPDSGNSAQQQQQSQAGGQFGREASAGDGASQGREQRNDDGTQGERWTANETASDGSSSSDAGRSGDVYM